jgi:hypothetical protein
MGLSLSELSMANNNVHQNNQLPIEQAEALQATLYNAANQALLKAMNADEVTPALLTSLNKMLSDANIQPQGVDSKRPLWSLADSMESLSYLDQN